MANNEYSVFDLPIQPKNSPGSTKKELYSDMFNDFVINPVTGDLARRVNEDAVRQSIRNLILTGRGERPFQPDIGSDIYQMLFENITPETVTLLESMITDTIESFEPRCRLLKVEVYSLIDTNDLQARIVFTVINSDREIELITPLTRAR